MAGGKIFADELGSESLRISQISGVRETLASGGNPDLTAYGPDDSPNLVIARFDGGVGTEYIRRSAGYYNDQGPAQLMGRVKAESAGGFAGVYGVGAPGSFVNGMSVALGSSYARVAAGAQYAQTPGHFISAYAKSEDTSTARIDAYGYGGAGSFVSGAVFASGVNTGRLFTHGAGAFAQGSISESGAGLSGAALMSAQANGAHSSGYIAPTGGTIFTSADGAMSRGMASSGGQIRGRGKGGLALGYANINNIDADGIGSFANGDATAGNIEANGRNSQQFGVGVNNADDVAQFGVGIRLHHLAAIPATPTNGSIWSDGTNVGIHSAGANQVFNRPTVTGAKAGNAALTSLIAGLAAMNIIVDSST